MRRYRPYIGYIIFGLIAIGILSNLLGNPGPFIIPLVVFGIVFYLYKFPPNRFRKRSSARSTKQPSKTNTNKRTTFRVIRGNKRDDDDPPRYH